MQNKITQCFEALKNCYDLQEMIDTVQDFSISTGDWSIEIVDNETVKVTNTYFDKLSETMKEDEDEFETNITRDSVFRLMSDVIEIDLTDTGCAMNVIIHERDEDKLKDLVKQALELYEQNDAEESAAEYFMQLVEDNDLFIFYDFE